MSLTLWKSPRLKFQIGREARALRSDVVVVATYFYLALRGERGWAARFVLAEALGLVHMVPLDFF